MDKSRCDWCGDDALYMSYHDNEWGVPVFDDKLLFEFLVLETFQAGLSWITVLKRREGYKRVFKDFDPEKVTMESWVDESRGFYVPVPGRPHPGNNH